MWTARVTVPGTAMKNGDPVLATFDDVSAKVTLEMTASNFDRARHELTVAARLKNTSKDTVRGPFELRAITVLSDLGVPVATNTDAGGSGDGGVWHFGSAVPSGMLLPGAVSDSRNLTFRIDNPREAALLENPSFGMLSMDAKILALGVPSGSPKP